MPTESLPETPTAEPDLVGPEQEFEQLVRTNQKMVWRYLRLLGADRVEADDLMQETFLRAVGQVSDGRQLRAPAAFLRTVARNLLVSTRRESRRRPPAVAWTDAVDALLVQEPEGLGDGRQAALRHCLERLGGRARLAVELHHVEGLSYRELGARLGLRKNGIRALLQRSRQVLRECMRCYMSGERS